MELEAHPCESVKYHARIFADHAAAMRRAGFAVLPLARAGSVIKGEVSDGKDPLVANFDKWKRRPGRVTFDKWCAKFPDANVGYVPGVTGKYGIEVLDDDGGAREKLIELLGDTPGKVGTRRGGHLLYRTPKGFDGQGINLNLKQLGINADWKRGNDIVVGPGSVHKSGHVYTWDGCDERVIADLPVLDLSRVRKLLRSQEAPAGSQLALKTAAGFRNGSRELGLNDFLCKHGSWCDEANELFGLACDWNERLAEKLIDKLSGVRVMQIAQAVWKDVESGKIKRWHKGSAVIRSDLAEIKKLTTLSLKDGAHAYTMLMALRAHHAARTARGETFAINQVAMVRDGTLPGFTRTRIEKCRELLVKAGLLVLAEKARNTKSGRVSAKYRLRMHVPTAPLAPVARGAG